LVEQGIAQAFVLAIAAALTVQGVTFFMRRGK
jgi:hypothetical protein